MHNIYKMYNLNVSVVTTTGVVPCVATAGGEIKWHWAWHLAGHWLASWSGELLSACWCLCGDVGILGIGVLCILLIMKMCQNLSNFNFGLLSPVSV